MKKTIGIGADPNATDLKLVIVQHLADLGYECEDYGSDDPIYANVSEAVALAVASGKHDRGILLCGTGLGVCMTANKVPGAYAFTATDPYSVDRSIKSNNANIFALGAQVVGPETAKMLLTIWMNAEYEPGGRSEKKVQRIREIESKHFSK